MSHAAAIVLDHRDAAGADVRDLYDRHGAYIRTLLQRLVGPTEDLDDLTQEVFLIAVRKRHRIPAEAPLQWLCGVTVKLASTTRRARRFKQFIGLEAAESLLDRHTPDQAAEAAEAERILYTALEPMSEKRRTVLVLYEIQELSGQEIASLLGIPLKTVWTRLFHARRELVDRVEALEHGRSARSGGSRGE